MISEYFYTNYQNKDTEQHFKKILTDILLKIDIDKTSRLWKEWFGYDIYKKPFDFEKKFQFCELDNLTFLHLRFDDINSWEKNLQHIFNIPNFKLLHKNNSKHFGYSKDYQNLKQSITFSRAEMYTIVSIYEKDINHFWTAEERQFNNF